MSGHSRRKTHAPPAGPRTPYTGMMLATVFLLSATRPAAGRGKTPGESFCSGHRLGDDHQRPSPAATAAAAGLGLPVDARDGSVDTLVAYPSVIQ
eukprot:gene2597-3300_t